MLVSIGLEESSSQKLPYNFKPTFLSLMQRFKQFSLILYSLSISLLPLDDISKIKSTFAALSLTTQTVLMERVTAHEVN